MKIRRHRYARLYLETETALSIGWAREMDRMARQLRLPRADWSPYFHTSGEAPLLYGELRAKGKKGMDQVEAWADAIGRERCTTGYTNGGAYYWATTTDLRYQPEDIPLEAWLSHEIQVGCHTAGYIPPPVTWQEMLAMPADEQLRAWTEKRPGWAFLSLAELTPACQDLVQALTVGEKERQ